MAEIVIPDETSGQDLVIDPEIPGQVGWNDLVAIARAAKRIPENGVLVETGSLFGRSAFVWSRNAHPSVKIFCIDPWIREQWIIDGVEAKQSPALPFSVEAFQHYTATCPNITAIQGFSPDVCLDWNTPVDLWFDDSAHDEPGLGKNHEFWLPKVKPGGTVCGDDYGDSCPDVIARADGLAKSWGVELSREERFWMLTKPS